LSHNFSSNFRLKSGTAHITAMRQAGVTVALNLDRLSHNDRADMFEEMRLVHRRQAGLSA
jgi:cytosine/adenosine deaminase-related metal-dependent hydrolase